MRRRNVQHGQRRPMPGPPLGAVVAVYVLLPLLAAGVIGVYAALAA